MTDLPFTNDHDHPRWRSWGFSDQSRRILFFGPLVRVDDAIASVPGGRRFRLC